nr:hypothetical protein [Corynebacterium jeikeium]
MKDGKPDGEPTVTTEQTKAPKNAKIRVGTKTTGETTKTVEAQIPFGVKIEFDPEHACWLLRNCHRRQAGQEDDHCDSEGH